MSIFEVAEVPKNNRPFIVRREIGVRDGPAASFSLDSPRDLKGCSHTIIRIVVASLRSNRLRRSSCIEDVQAKILE